MSIEQVMQNLSDSPEPPRTPGKSPMPSQPCITHITQNLVLSLSTSSRSCASNEPSILVAATPLKSSRMFSPNVTIHIYHPLLPPILIQAHCPTFVLWYSHQTVSVSLALHAMHLMSRAEVHPPAPSLQPFFPPTTLTQSTYSPNGDDVCNAQQAMVQWCGHSDSGSRVGTAAAWPASAALNYGNSNGFSCSDDV